MSIVVSRQFPVGQVIQQIIDKLVKRHWNAPNITWKNWGGGRLRELRGQDWGITFLGRETVEPWEISVLGKEIHLFPDESGPVFYYYIGGNWKKDREKFILHTKIHSRLYRLPRTYLRYKGGFFLPNEPGPHYLYRGKRAPYLVPNNDLGREYDPGPNDPPYFVTADVFADINAWLEMNILAKL